MKYDEDKILDKEMTVETEQQKEKLIDEDLLRKTALVNLEGGSWLTRLASKLEARRVVRKLRKDPAFKHKTIEVRSQFYMTIRLKD